MVPRRRLDRPESQPRQRRRLPILLGGAGAGTRRQRGRRGRMSKPIYVLSGPNLNLLGDREPELYGKSTLDEIKTLCDSRAAAKGRTVVFRQTNHEGELIDW